MENNDANLFLPDAKPRLISRQFIFTEGAAVDSIGNIFFTDQPNDKIWNYTLAGELKLFTDRSGRSNGLYLDKAGNIIGCADEKGELVSFSPDAKMRVLIGDTDGKRLNGPNDLWIDPKGGIYFTDPYYERDYWESPKPVPREQYVYYLPTGQAKPIIVEKEVIKPNGIVGTPDGKNLFIADIEGDKTYKYEITPDGTLTGKKLFVAMGSDGITLDNKGNLYICGKGVTIFDNTGKKLSHIPIDEGWTGNLCFGGKDKQDLFITASKGVYIMPMLVHGVE